MKAHVPSALVLLLVAAGLRADPPGVVERLRQGGGKVIRNPKTGEVTWLALPPSATDADLAGLCELRALRALVLNGKQVSDEGLRTVARLPQMTALALLGNTCTDADLRHLEAMRGLRVLNVVGCPNVTAEGVARLRKALPDCVIEYLP
jgi:hypothetical protein